MFVKDEYAAHRKYQDDGGPLTHLEGPGDVRQIVENHVWERRIPIHVWDTVVDDDHDECGEHEDEEHVNVADKQLDKVGVEVTRNVAHGPRSDYRSGSASLTVRGVDAVFLVQATLRTMS